MFNAILWIMKTGAPWRDLHPELGPWKTVHKRFFEWARLEVRDDILRMLSINADPEAIILMPPLLSCTGTVPAQKGALQS